MRYSIVLLAVAIFGGLVSSQDHRLTSSGVDQFVIGRHTFIDVGPPNDFYEIFLVGPISGGASIERITLTPATDICLLPAKVDISSGSINESPAMLLGATNPCTIPEKELRSELRRCKNCLVFSGANVAMQVQCGAKMRIVRSDILDRDIFGSKPNTPRHTSWTMGLLTRLDEATGPGVLDRPIFPILAGEKAPVQDEHVSPAVLDVSSGKYDSLFQGAPDKPSDLYRAAQIPPPIPNVRLERSMPFQPTTSGMPVYPLIAKAAHVEGTVSFRMAVDANGNVSDISFDSGSPLLRGAVKTAASGWKFSEDASNKEILATIDFALNCPTQRRSP